MTDVKNNPPKIYAEPLATSVRDFSNPRTPPESKQKLGRDSVIKKDLKKHEP